MSNWSIQTKILSIVVVFGIGFSVHAAVVHRKTPETFEESDYRDVIVMKDIVADVLPPPLYAIEAQLVTLKAARETDSDELAQLRAKWKQLQIDYAQRHDYWRDHLPPSNIRTALLETSKRGADRLFSLGDNQFWPALEHKDAARVEAALSEMESAYRDHRAGIDDVVALANKQTEANIASAASTIHDRKLLLIFVGVFMTLLGAGVALAIARNIAGRTRGMASTLQRVAAGDLSQRAETEPHDELGEMATQLNQTLDTIERVFDEVRSVAASLAEAATKLASSSDSISHGAQQQAASLEETAASLEEITATVKQSAGNAEQADRVAVGSRDVAEKGGSVVAEAISAMDEITKGSRRIGDIITTIDEIALQTNLLALNAAVEAARAGEQGRGFAVVASEVGNLAQRSAAAAKEVKSLIQDSLERIQAGHELVGESGRALNDIIVSVKQVTAIVGEIASASREQSIGVDQVNQAVSQMDQVTQSNAAQTDQLSHTAQGLADSAEQLTQLLMRFQLSQDRRDVGRGPSAGTPRAAASGNGKRRQRPRLPAPSAEPRDFAAHTGANDNSDGSDDFEVLSSSDARSA